MKKGITTVTVRVSVDIDVEVDVSPDNECEIIWAEVRDGDVDRKRLAERVCLIDDKDFLNCLDSTLIETLAIEEAAVQLDDAEALEADLANDREAEERIEE